MYLLSVRRQLLERYTVNYQILHVSAIFGHHKVDFTIKSMEKNTGVDALTKQLTYSNR